MVDFATLLNRLNPYYVGRCSMRQNVNIMAKGFEKS